MTQLFGRCAALIEELGIAARSEITAVEPLTGGVASDIARVDLGSRSVCVKFALPKLKVAADWHAPVHRNAAEYAWLKFAARVCPDSAVSLLGRSETQHGFAMEFMAGQDVFLWKSALLDEAPDQGEASAVGDMLGRIHQASARSEFDTSGFDNRDDFRALRIEPYLSFTATNHSELDPVFQDLAQMLYEGSSVLVHGDVSPKNILFRASGPVILDAECATIGDASFDPAFCLNHLMLKAVHLPGSRVGLLSNGRAFWAAYARLVDWEDVDALEARVCLLLPALMLGRVDGKSPVEYLDDNRRDHVRRLGSMLLADPAPTIETFTTRVADALKEMEK